MNVDIKNASVSEALKEIFKPQQIDVKIDGNVAMISAAAAKNFTVKVLSLILPENRFLVP